MTKPLALTERQVTALCRGAAKAGRVPVLEINGVVVRLLPEGQAPQNDNNVDMSAEPETFTSLADYMAWRDRSRARED